MRSVRLDIAVATLCFCMPAVASPISDDFAIKCDGFSTTSDKYIKNGEVESENFENEVYIIKTKQNSIYHVDFRRQQLNPICWSDQDGHSAYITQGLITLYESEEKDDLTTHCNMEIDRKTGVAKYGSRMETDSGWFHQTNKMMTCVQTDVPIFDASGNRF